MCFREPIAPVNHEQAVYFFVHHLRNHFARRVVQRNRQHNRCHDFTDLTRIDILHLKARREALIGTGGQVCPFIVVNFTSMGMTAVR